MLCVGGHTRYPIKDRRLRWRVGLGFFFALIPVPALTGGCGRTGCSPPDADYARWTAIFAEPVAVYILITALVLWRIPTWEPWDARLGRSLMRLTLRDGGGRRRGKPDSS